MFPFILTCVLLADRPEYIPQRKLTVYVALEDNIASQQVKDSLETNYVAIGSDTGWYELDAIRNGLRTDLDIRYVVGSEVPAQTPAISLDGGKWSYYPDPKPDAVLWLYVFKSIQDDWTLTNRMIRWEWLKRQHSEMIYALDTHWEYHYGGLFWHHPVFNTSAGLDSTRSRMQREFKIPKPE